MIRGPTSPACSAGDNKENFTHCDGSRCDLRLAVASFCVGDCEEVDNRKRDDDVSLLKMDTG